MDRERTTREQGRLPSSAIQGHDSTSFRDRNPAAASEFPGSERTSSQAWGETGWRAAARRKDRRSQAAGPLRPPRRTWGAFGSEPWKDSGLTGVVGSHLTLPAFRQLLLLRNFQVALEHTFPADPTFFYKRPETTGAGRGGAGRGRPHTERPEREKQRSRRLPPEFHRRTNP